MALKTLVRRSLAVLACLAVATTVGCSSSTVTLTNMSDTWLDVSYYVQGSQNPGDRDTEMPGVYEDEDQSTFLSHERLQVKPGGTVKYPLTRNLNYKYAKYPLVHAEVQPVSPSWESCASDTSK